MILWRISEHAALDGAGGIVIAGRWHSAGRPVVYTAESSALAMLEVLVHLEVDEFPPSFQLLRIEALVGIARVEWPAREDARDERVTRAWGDAWLDKGETMLARTPPAIAPLSFNWLINPRHRDAARLKLVAASRWPWDERLFRG